MSLIFYVMVWHCCIIVGPTVAGVSFNLALTLEYQNVGFYFILAPCWNVKMLLVIFSLYYFGGPTTQLSDQPNMTAYYFL